MAIGLRYETEFISRTRNSHAPYPRMGNRDDQVEILLSLKRDERSEIEDEWTALLLETDICLLQAYDYQRFFC